MELMEASQQWATRPNDEKFLDLDAMQAYLTKRHSECQQTIFDAKALKFDVSDAGNIRLKTPQAKVGAKSVCYDFTNWSFQQFCNRVGAPVYYLDKMPAQLAKQNLEFSLARAKAEKVQLLTQVNGKTEVRAVTSETYGRIWDHEVTQVILDNFGNGRDGRFKIPGEFGKQVDITMQNTTLYAGDRNIFIFLTDEENRIELPNRRDGQSGSLARGFFVGNSEVGGGTIFVKTFLFDYVCMNRIVWGAENVAEIKWRHSKFAPQRFAEMLVPALKAYAAGTTHNIEEAIEQARNYTFESPDVVTEFVHSKFPKHIATRMNAVHMLEEFRPIESVWDVVTAATALARNIPFADVRIDVETKAGDLLKMFASK